MTYGQTFVMYDLGEQQLPNLETLKLAEAMRGEAQHQLKQSAAKNVVMLATRIAIGAIAVSLINKLNKS